MRKFLPFDEALAVAQSLKLANSTEWHAWCKEGMCPPNVPRRPDATYKDGGWQGWGHWLGSGNIEKASKFAPFGQALTFAQSLGLASEKAWRAWCKEGRRPPIVPSHPNATYKDGGWQGWVHWLGSGNIKKPSKFVPFDQALTFAHSLGLANNKEWHAWSKEGRRPPNVPSAPDKAYKDGGWQGWGHWLGTSNAAPSKKFLPFGEALRVARSLRLVSEKEWRVWCRSGARPANVPARPDKTYVHDGWMGWQHWLRRSAVRPTISKFLPFDAALAVARSLRLANRFEWEEWCEEGMRPPNVPSSPHRTYNGGGWQGWGHWLGSGSIVKANKFAPFGQALTYAQSLGLASRVEWRVWCNEGRRPPNVPALPSQVYEDAGWQGWGHWLGTGTHASQAKQSLPFDEALAVARSLNLANQFEWQQWSKEGMRPPNVPAAPDKTFKDGGWQGWVHWLGSGGIKKPSKFAPFGEALTFARSLGLANQKEWQVWCKEGRRPPNVPSAPNATYKDGGWQGWGHWLGTGNTQRGTEQFLPFKEALAVVQSLRLASVFEWKAWSREGMRPPNVPSNPRKVYEDSGWQGWGHWLGTGNAAPSTSFLPFDEALLVARCLRLVSQNEWRAWCRSGARPANVPANPDQTYAHDGWTGWVHWLSYTNLGAAVAPAATRPRNKRAAAGGAGKGGGKRRRR